MKKYLSQYKQKDKSKSKHLRVKSQDDTLSVQPQFQNFTRAYFSKIVLQVTFHKKTYKMVFEKNTPLSIVRQVIFKSLKPRKPLFLYSLDSDYIFDYQLQQQIGFLKNHTRLSTFPVNELLYTRGTINAYKICDCFSVGGFSKVYLLRSYKTGEFFAGKFIDKFPQNESRINLIRNEKEINEILDHPFLVKMHEFIEMEEFYVFILDFCSAGELFTMMKSHRNMSESEARFYFIQVLLAFQYLHQKNIVYRDLKPQNILLDKYGHIKLADFGLAKYIREKAYSYCGSLEYMAPEIIEGDGHSFGVDFYSLGVLLFELMVGCPPFYDPSFSSKDTKYHIVHSEVRFPQRKVLTPEFKDLIEKLLRKDQDERLGSHYGLKQIFSHPWIGKINKKDYESYRIKPPFLPKVSSEAFQKDLLPKQDIIKFTKRIQKNIEKENKHDRVDERKQKKMLKAIKFRSFSRDIKSRNSSSSTIEFKDERLRIRDGNKNNRDSEMSLIEKFMKKKDEKGLKKNQVKKKQNHRFQFEVKSRAISKKDYDYVHKIKDFKNVYKKQLKSILKQEII